MLNNLRGRLFSSEFSKNVTTLMSGSIIGQIIPLLVAPILARLYSPEEFGMLALMLSLFHIIGVAINGAYEQAIILPDRRLDSIKLVLVCVFIDTVLSLVLLAIVLIFKDNILNVLGTTTEFFPWLISLPLLVWILGIYNPLSFYVIDKKGFRALAISNISRATVNNGISLGTSSLLNGLGLLLGQIMGHIVMVFTLSRLFIKDLKKELASINDISSYKELILRYKDFPKYTIWSGFFNSISLNINNLYINRGFSSYELGLYSYSYKYINLPLNLIGNSFKRVFLEAANSERKKTGCAKTIFLKTVLRLVLVALPGFLVAHFIIEDLFTIVFGKQWAEAGYYAKLLIPMFFVRFLASPLSVVNQIFEKQFYGLLINLSILIISVAVILISMQLNLNLENFIQIYSWTFAVVYALVLMEEYLVVSNKI
jgi:O-antigen/teichoic acid export membrane protein